MKSHITERFREAFERLPENIQRQAREVYKLFVENPYHPGLRFRQVHPTKPIYSARIGLNYRALAIRDGEDIIWFWIGSHADYDRLISDL